jgi:hypothetical protein
MTVIAVYEDAKRYWIGSDSMGVSDTTKVEFGSKLIDKGSYIVGVAGSYRVMDIIRESKLLPDYINGIADFRVFRDAIIEPILDIDTDSLTFEVTVISPRGIFNLEPEFQIHRIRCGYLACGSGADIAIGALAVCKKLKIDGSIAIPLVIKASILHTTLCGGRVHIASMKKR